MTDVQRSHSELRCSRPTADMLRIELAGHWRLQDEFPALTDVEQSIEAAPRAQRLTFDTTGLTGWDSGLVTFLLDLLDLAAQRQLVVDQEGLPDGLRRLLRLATAVPERQGARREALQEPFLSRVGKATIDLVTAASDILGFIGEALLALVKLCRGQARFRPVELMLLIQECGAQALPIVTLICFLVGAILAFIGAVQLGKFGAQLYVADLVALAMALEMGAMMTAIIMAGRTGAAFAAQLGTMTVNEEIDALTTLGLSPGRGDPDRLSGDGGGGAFLRPAWRDQRTDRLLEYLPGGGHRSAHEPHVPPQRSGWRTAVRGHGGGDESDRGRAQRGDRDGYRALGARASAR